ncbi:MAG: type I-U CRISPR-associated protein Cas7 [Acidobacteria bacterium]|nr:type I-U CRISPR-associated protein Cas7 [Acidobacteriota bacterium]
MKFDELRTMTSDDAAFRRRQVLQPVGGKGDKIFPPTYPAEEKNGPPRHVYERRRVNGEEKWCVLVDSVQSQANRLEESLLEAIRNGLKAPYVVVDFSKAGLDGIGEITSLDAPHRVYDAILRDSLLDGEPFMKSETGKRLAKAKLQDASSLLEASPTALLFGAWHSTGEGGALGAKFARSLTSEIVAIDVPVEESLVTRTGELVVRTAARRTGSRIDPLGVLRKVEVFKGESGWSTDQSEAGKKAKKVRPSEINHGNIAPSIQALGITCDHLEHTFVLSFAALRRLRFGSPEKNEIGRALLAALGLVALAEQDARGYALRSRCDLVCDGRAAIEQVQSDGSTNKMSLDLDASHALYEEARAAAKMAGFALRDEPLRLQPQDKLVEIVRQSQELALAGAGGEDDEGAGDS